GILIPCSLSCFCTSSNILSARSSSLFGISRLSVSDVRGVVSSVAAGDPSKVVLVFLILYPSAEAETDTSMAAPESITLAGMDTLYFPSESVVPENGSSFIDPVIPLFAKGSLVSASFTPTTIFWFLPCPGLSILMSIDLSSNGFEELVMIFPLLNLTDDNGE